MVGPADGADVLDDLMTLADQSLIQRDETPPAPGSGSGCSRPSARSRSIASGGGRGRRRRSDDAMPRPTSPWPRPPRRTCPGPTSRAGSIGSPWSTRTCAPPSAGRSTRARPTWRSASSRRCGGSGSRTDGWSRPPSSPNGPSAMPGADQPTTTRVAALSAAGGIAYWHGRPEDAHRHYEEQLALARRLDDLAGQADATWNLCFDRYIAEDPASSAGAAAGRAADVRAARRRARRGAHRLVGDGGRVVRVTVHGPSARAHGARRAVRPPRRSPGTARRTRAPSPGPTSTTATCRPRAAGSSGRSSARPRSGTWRGRRSPCPLRRCSRTWPTARRMARPCSAPTRISASCTGSRPPWRYRTCWASATRTRRRGPRSARHATRRRSSVDGR